MMPFGKYQIQKHNTYKPHTRRGIDWDQWMYPDIFQHQVNVPNPKIDVHIEFGLTNRDVYFTDENEQEFFASVMVDITTGDYSRYTKVGFKDFKDAQDFIEKDYLTLEKLTSLQQVEAWARKHGMKSENEWDYSVKK